MRYLPIVFSLLFCSLASAKVSAININKATSSELVATQLLNQHQASALVAYKKSHGAFKHWADVCRVSGLESNACSKLHAHHLLTLRSRINKMHKHLVD